MTTLNRAALDGLAPSHRPLVDPGELRPRIVHFGLGAFHRAHQAVYTEAAAARSGEPWGIVAVAPRSASAVAAMRAQDCLYSVTDRAPGAGRTRVVGAIVDALAMGPDAARIDELIAAPEVSTLTLTVTEKGYSRRPDGALDTAAPGVAADLAATAGPDGAELATVVGRLSASLAARFRRGGAPIDVISCDNMAGNGAALRGVLRGFVEASSWPDRSALLDWMASSVGFPATIVDRIVPATTAADRVAVAAALGLRDEMPVSGEPYRQWVLEDAFRAPRPRWELDGALVVPDVAPYALMKLRLLNGSHSAMAYLGAAAGCRTVADVLATEWGERLVRSFGAEVAPTLPDAGPDAAKYIDELVERFRNPAMAHLLRQVGSDGSLKLPERWLDALRALRAVPTSTPTLELALAGWVNATRPARSRRAAVRHDRSGRRRAGPLLAGRRGPHRGGGGAAAGDRRGRPGRGHRPGVVGGRAAAGAARGRDRDLTSGTDHIETTGQRTPPMTESTHAAPAGVATRTTRDLTKAAVSGWLGTAMEFMDFQLYSLAAAIVFNKIFFPNVSPAIGLIAAMATYGVGYVARLAGAIYFGRMGDRIGRKKVLFLTIALMGASTTLIGVLPTYAMIGIAAPILLVVLRLVQGFGAGAEIAGATVMLAEYAPVKRRGVIASLVSLGTNSGTLAASALWAFLLGALSEEQLLSWGWRLPFLLSFVLLIFAVWLRLNLKESPVFEERPDVVDGVALSKEQIAADAHASVLEAGLRQRKGKAFFLALGLRFGQAGNSGLVQTFLVGYIATALLVAKTVPTQAIVWGSLLGFVTVPVVGLLGDRFGRRPVYIALTLLTMAFAFPMMWMITSGSVPTLELAMVIGLNIGVLGLFSLESVTMAELFGSRTRFTQLALAKEIGGILATAIGPVLAATLTAVTGSWWPIAVMLIVYSLITLVSAYLAPETRGRDLVRLEDAV